MEKSRPRNPRKGKKVDNQLPDMGIFNIPNMDLDENSGEEGSDSGDSALESELEALISGKRVSKAAKPKRKAPKAVNIETLAAECLKDVEEDDYDGDLSTDEDLVAELQALTLNPASPVEGHIPESTSINKRDSANTSNKAEISPVVNMLEERLDMYKKAIDEGQLDSSKVRRYNRAVKKLEELLKAAKSGQNVNEEDIPPIVKVFKMKPQPDAEMQSKSNIQVPTPRDDSADGDKKEVPVTSVRHKVDVVPSKTSGPTADLAIQAKLLERRDLYKHAALKAKTAGDTLTAIKYVKIAKTFDAVIEDVKCGKPVDLSNMPPPPPENCVMVPPVDSSKYQKNSAEVQTSETPSKTESVEMPPDSGESEVYKAPPPPSSALEALQQRLQKYISTRDEAQAAENNSKFRRLQRIIKSYEIAIRDHKAGKTVNFEELPVPPGFAPFPNEIVPEVAEPAAAKPSQEAETSIPVLPDTSKKVPPRPDRKSYPEGSRPKLQRTNTSVLDKQLSFLLQRQKYFREAALAAKKNGDIQQAKEYLRMSKGFDSMIEATKSGLPIDASAIPTPPQLESDFVVVEASDCVEISGEDTQDELLENLRKDLEHQVEVCQRNKEHFLKLGDVSSASKFEKLGIESKKDLLFIQNLVKNGQPAPLFHYETRLFSMVQCHPDLSDSDLEVTVQRGINLPGKPDALDSYVKIELPIPSEAPQYVKTHTVHDTNNPVYQEEFKFTINRKSRSQVRLFKRQAVKLEVWSKGGIFRSDILLGTVSIKLVDLESKCSIHDSFDLMEGRKARGGKLEVSVRMRDPLLVKQIEEVREKWLVIGS